jgi:hypothetical protein
MKLIIAYWVLTVIYGMYWLIKHPSQRHGDDMETFSLMDVLGTLFPAIILAPFLVPMMMLESIKFKR